MTEPLYLTQQFEAARPHLYKVAYRMLGSGSEAEDAVQEAWLRLNRVDAVSIDNLTGWLTTAVSRLCLDMLRARKPAHDTSGNDVADIADEAADDLEAELLQVDLIGPALLLLLDLLTPIERIA
ncbi:MAG TPA: sigma factor, partial [Rheinheimera sp.]|nr:sigma factor [Rheinheimera sp.]